MFQHPVDAARACWAVLFNAEEYRFLGDDLGAIKHRPVGA